MSIITTVLVAVFLAGTAMIQYVSRGTKVPRTTPLSSYITLDDSGLLQSTLYVIAFIALALIADRNGHWPAAACAVFVGLAMVVMITSAWQINSAAAVNLTAHEAEGWLDLHIFSATFTFAAAFTECGYILLHTPWIWAVWAGVIAAALGRRLDHDGAWIALDERVGLIALAVAVIAGAWV